MTNKIEQRLRELAVELPLPIPSAASYVPGVISGNLLYISGQLPLKAGEVAFRGRLGQNIDISTGQAAARLCAINILAQAKGLLLDLDRVSRVIRLCGFVSAAADFYDHHKVINGASDFLISVFGELGRHSRFAVGVTSLPLGAAVEIDALLEIV